MVLSLVTIPTKSVVSNWNMNNKNNNNVNSSSSFSNGSSTTNLNSAAPTSTTSSTNFDCSLIVAVNNLNHVRFQF